MYKRQVYKLELAPLLIMDGFMPYEVLKCAAGQMPNNGKAVFKFTRGIKDLYSL